MSEQTATFRFMKRKNLGNYEHEEAEVTMGVPIDENLHQACDAVRSVVFAQLGMVDTFHPISEVYGGEEHPFVPSEQPTKEEKPKRKRRTKAEMEAARKAEEAAQQPASEVAPQEPAQAEQVALEQAIAATPPKAADASTMTFPQFAAEMNALAAAKGADAVMLVLGEYMPEDAKHVGLQLVPENKRQALLDACTALADASAG